MKSKSLKCTNASLNQALACIDALEPRRLLTTYYVSPTGSDTNSGTSAGAPWQTVAKVNATDFQPGDSILFQYGSQFHDELSASSNGSASAPITYGAYGDSTQPNPEFFGSDPLDISAFTLVTGTTYSIPSTTAIGWVYDNQQFTLEATDVLAQSGNSESTDPATNINYVESNSETFYYDTSSTTLYVNVGGPLAGHTLTATTRYVEINTNVKSDLIFQHLDVTECAADANTFAFDAQGPSSNIQFLDCNATYTGKHAFGAIDSTDFLGENLLANQTAPDLGFGGASAFVTFSDNHDAGGDTSQWINCTYTNPNGYYEAFITHGDSGAIRSVLIQNMVSNNGYGTGLDCEPTGDDETITVVGGLFSGELTIDTNNSVVEGVTLTQSAASVGLYGNNDLVQNCVFTDLAPDVYAGSNGGIVIDGTGDVARFNSFSFTGGPAISIMDASNSASIYANIFGCTNPIWLLFDGNGTQSSNDNVFSPNSTFYAGDTITAKTLTTQQWQALGYDAGSVVGDPGFVDASAGNLELSGSSPAIDLYTATPDSSIAPITSDFAGNPRPYGAGYDAGAYEYESPKIPITGSFSVAGITVNAPLPGTSTIATFTVTLSSAQTSTETVQYSTADGTAGAGTDYTATAGTLTFAPGVTSQAVNVMVAPALAADSSKTFELVLSNPSTGISISSTAAAAAATATVSDIGETTASFGGKKTGTYTDAAGHKVTLKLGGPGTGTVVFSGITDPVQIVVTGTSVASSLTVLSTGGVTTLPDVFASSPFGSLTANATLVGSLQFAHPVSRVTLASVSSEASIYAPAISSLAVRGAFAANVNITGALSSARVGSITGGVWKIGGKTGSVAAASTAAAWTSTFTGGVQSLAVSGTLAGSLFASAVRSLSVRGGVSGATIMLSGNGVDLAAMTVGGAVTDSTIRSAGSIGSVTAGATTDSFFFAGVSSSLTTLPATTADFTGNDQIASFTITQPRSQTTGFSNTLVAAATISKIKVKGVLTDNGGTPFGFAVEKIAAFSDTQPGLKPFNWTSKMSPSLLTFEGDFKVSVIS